MIKGGAARRKTLDNLGTMLLALVLAMVVWANATYQNDMPREDYFPDTIPIEMLNAPNDLVVVSTSKSVDQVRVRIRAFSSSWAGLLGTSFRATAELKGLGEGVHDVPVRVTCSDRTVTILRTQPEQIFIQLERRSQESAEVRVDLTDQDTLPLGYSVNPPEVEPMTVTVQGPASAVNSVAVVMGSVSILGQRAPFEKTVEVHPLDGDGKAVSGVKLAPQTVRVKLNIEKKLNYREVAVLARTKGSPARGYFVSSVNVDPTTITVVGPPAVIATMPGLVSCKGEVDVSGATRMIAERLDLDLPAGVSVLTEEEGATQKVLVTVEIGAVMGGTTVEVPLNVRRLQPGLVARLSVPTVDVFLTGPAVVLDDLQIGLLEAFVDLNGLNVGTQQVKPQVALLIEKNPKLVDLVVTSISPASIEADISEPTPTPTPTSTLTPTPTLTPTLTLTETLRTTPTSER